MKKPAKKRGVGKWVFIGVIILILLFIAIIITGASMALFSGSVSMGIGNTAVIQVKGLVVSEGSGAFFGPTVAVSTDIIEQIERADSDPSIKAIMFEINSPGGQPVATDEILTAIENTDKPTVAWIREIGASAAYWIASSTDHVIANRLSLTGSVGVTASYLQFSGFLDNYNITYEQFAMGNMKEVGSPFRELTDSERAMLNEMMRLLHQEFVNDVAEKRNLNEQQIEEISTSAVYLGMQAKELNLVDELGGKQEALDYIEEQINKTPKLVTYKKKKGFLNTLTGAMAETSFAMGKAFRNGLFSSNLDVRT